MNVYQNFELRTHQTVDSSSQLYVTGDVRIVLYRIDTLKLRMAFIMPKRICIRLDRGANKEVTLVSYFETGLFLKNVCFQRTLSDLR